MSVNAFNAVKQTAVARRTQHAIFAVDQREGDRRARQREFRQIFVDLRCLCRSRFQKLLPRGSVEKQILDEHRRSQRATLRFDQLISAAVQSNERAEFVALQSSPHRKLRHRGNRRQRLAAKTERRNALQLGSRREFARGVRSNCETRVFSIHANAVIRHFDVRLAAVDNFDINASRLRVDGVFDQLFDNRRRTLDNLARRNLVNRIDIEQFDAQSISS